MNKHQLIEILSNKYTNDNWRTLLNSFFPAERLNEHPENLKNDAHKKHEIVNFIRRLGYFKLSDDSFLGLYEVELIDDKSVSKNRVELRNLLSDQVIPGDTDAALVAYYSVDDRDWRISLISKSRSWDDEGQEFRWETEPRRYTFVVGEQESIKTTSSQLLGLLGKAEDGIKVDDLVKAFSVERLSNEFFKGFFHHFQSFEAFIIDHNEYFEHFLNLSDKEQSADDQQKEAERYVRNFLKRLLGRILFLYFLQKKGWLGVPVDDDWKNGDKEFISNLFKSCEDKIRFYPDVLVQLFFYTLNNPDRENNLFPITDSKVPYLNGGLFDQDSFEPTSIQFDPALFEGFIEFLNGYNFTIDENAPGDEDYGVDPEMLGLIFENLLEDNRDKGTFYTPKEVVHFMCKESLSQYLREKLFDKVDPKVLQEIDQFVKFNSIGVPTGVAEIAVDIDGLLERVKICDPAIGSGAFPMGMVYEILRIRKELFGFIDKKKSFDYGKEKLRIIRDSIYGVDLDKGAVDIARLRFWISIVLDDSEPKPLPNLDYKIMQGDSLVESFEGIPLDNVIEKDKSVGVTIIEGQLDLFEKPKQMKMDLSAEQQATIEKLVAEYFEPHDTSDKRGIRANIEEIVHDNIELIFDKQKSILDLKIAEATANLALITVNDKLSEGAKKKRLIQKEKIQSQIDRLEKEQEKLVLKLKKLDEISEREEKPYFLWHIYFKDIFKEHKGFDIVIANPPYGVKIEKHLQEHFGLGSRDSYGAFVGMGLSKLLKDGGVLCNIVSDTWLTIGSHYQLREQILDKHQLRNVIRLHQDCFKATVNSCIMTVVKKDPKLDKAAIDHKDVYTTTEFMENPLVSKVLAADLTNLSTRKNLPEFRDKLFHLDQYLGQSTPEFAVYKYDQDLLEVSNNWPVIVGSPKMFLLLDEFDCDKEKVTIGEGDNAKEIEVRKIKYDDQVMVLVRFGDIAEVKQGLATGDNDYYLYQNPEARGNYKDINLFKKYLLTDDDISKIHDDDELRLKVIEKGIHNSKKEDNFDKSRWFEGRYIVPFDKGGESDTDGGWLPCYNVQTEYYIDWSTSAIDRFKTYTIADRIRDKNESKTVLEHYKRTPAAVIRNSSYYFKFGITFSPTGIYSPTFRYGDKSIFGNKGSTIFSSFFASNYLLGILNSKLFRYLTKSYQSHTVETGEHVIFSMPIPKNFSKDISALVEKIIQEQELNSEYIFLENEQKEIDKRVYQLYGLNKEDINEVEIWFARRYPKLAKYADIKPMEELVGEAVSDNKEEELLAIIQKGESKSVEFKSTLRFCLKQRSPQKYIEHSAFKNLAAFLNTEGGTLFIGVDDDGHILGLDSDFNSFKGDNKEDEFLKHFDNLVEHYFGNHYSKYFEIEFPIVRGIKIAVIEVKEKSPKPVILLNKEKNKEEFYIRRFASAKDLSMFEYGEYIKTHWG